MKTLLAIVFTSACFAQQTIPLTVIQPGSNLCTGLLQHDDLWKDVNGTGDVQVAQKITCTIPIPSFDEYIVVVKLFEPLTTLNSGMRVFTININGEQKTIDLMRLIGYRKIFDASFVVAAEKTLTINFDASTRTALFSQIIIQRKLSNQMAVMTLP